MEDEKFYSGKEVSGIYGYFRKGMENEAISGMIYKPTGENDKREAEKTKLEIEGKYKVDWQPLNEKYMYYIISIED